MRSCCASTATDDEPPLLIRIQRHFRSCYRCDSAPDRLPCVAALVTTPRQGITSYFPAKPRSAAALFRSYKLPTFRIIPAPATLLAGAGYQTEKLRQSVPRVRCTTTVVLSVSAPAHRNSGNAGGDAVDNRPSRNPWQRCRELHRISGTTDGTGEFTTSTKLAIPCRWNYVWIRCRLGSRTRPALGVPQPAPPSPSLRP